MVEIKWFTEAKEDYDSLDGSQKIHIDKGIERIKSVGMQAGKPLKGDLSYCREIKHNKLGLRIIFKESEGVINVVEIITIGKREEKKVFKVAVSRLG